MLRKQKTIRICTLAGIVALMAFAPQLALAGGWVVPGRVYTVVVQVDILRADHGKNLTISCGATCNDGSSRTQNVAGVPNGTKTLDFCTGGGYGIKTLYLKVLADDRIIFRTIEFNTEGGITSQVDAKGNGYDGFAAWAISVNGATLTAKTARQ